jgi:putative NIF3 family GTP cyclohydrolase 1 type 2
MLGGSMTKTGYVVDKIESFFKDGEFGPDSLFSMIIPGAYGSIGFPWETFFEADFVKRFSGLMLRGDDNVTKAYCAVFPEVGILDKFITTSSRGDILFVHHPLDLRSGDPQGKWAEGFIPIRPETLEQMKCKGLSFYACHNGLDLNKSIGTSVSIAKALNAKVKERFVEHGNGFIGIICTISPLSTSKLIDQLKGIFDIPYVDQEGPLSKNINTIAIVAGGGDSIDIMMEAERKGAQAYITGEIHHRIFSDQFRANYQAVIKYARTCKITLIGVSHAASEYLVMRNHMAEWFQTECAVSAEALPEAHWWR